MRFAARFMVQAWWFELVLPRFGMSSLAARGRNARMQHLAQRFHALAIDLGGLMIKVGQFMSSRLDILPPEITSELEGLQDEVPAVDFESIRALAESELGMPLAQAYAWVDPSPIAAASLGQVHRAQLSTTLAADAGFSAAVVKVQRPGIETIVEVDLAALRKIARWLSRVRIVSDHADMPTVVEEFAATSLQEIDYLQEGSNADRFASNFANETRVATPKIGWERTTRRVLTLSDVTAIKINDLDGLRAAGIDPAQVADELARVTFEQLFIAGFFHADPHPGNIFVTPRESAVEGAGREWDLTFIDFGMMGEIPDALRRGLQRLVVAVVARDGKGLVAGMQNIGVLLPAADTVDLERAMTELFDRFGGMAMTELQDVDPREMVDFADRFGDTIRELPFQLPENFLLVIRTISLVSGVCSALNPTFNMWTAVEPFANSLMRQQGAGTVKGFAKEAVSIVGVMAQLPRRMDELATRAERGQLAVQAPATERRLRTLERTARRIVSAVIFMALLLAGVLLRASDPVFGTMLMIVSVLPLLHAMFAGLLGRRSRD
ncbi:AarF/UbiB family protein [Microbacterium sp. NPDC076911]|uniref:ABC1 kinase family protein n=1 Tax=Microbacterium sp. NPDC076911 TaxID=3154958 RepID=UPI003420A4FE